MTEVLPIRRRIDAACDQLDAIAVALEMAADGDASELEDARAQLVRVEELVDELRGVLGGPRPVSSS